MRRGKRFAGGIQLIQFYREDILNRVRRATGGKQQQAEQTNRHHRFHGKTRAFLVPQIIRY
ncbi:hypothetical protein A6U98_03245 [Rhizobium sp. WYCCWR10014]|nr:hypothetical protein A6U98_03245 [Rhizobium sp. WYCCWR10014]